MSPAPSNPTDTIKPSNPYLGPPGAQPPDVQSSGDVAHSPTPSMLTSEPQEVLPCQNSEHLQVGEPVQLEQTLQPELLPRALPNPPKLQQQSSVASPSTDCDSMNGMPLGVSQFQRAIQNGLSSVTRPLRNLFRPVLHSDSAGDAPQTKGSRTHFSLNPKRRQSSLFGPASGARSFFPSHGARGLMAPALDTPGALDSSAADSHVAPTPGSQESTSGSSSHHPWSLRHPWTKFSLDLYFRLLERPRESRVRLKQTIALLPFLKLKPVIDLSSDPSWPSPLRMHLDVKAFGCARYRVTTATSAHAGVFQLRARAPLADPRFVLDVVYERDVATARDGVRVSFRAFDLAFLKAPRLGVGCKVPVRFAAGVKSTIRVKKYAVRLGEARGPGPSESDTRADRRRAGVRTPGTAPVRGGRADSGESMGPFEIGRVVGLVRANENTGTRRTRGRTAGGRGGSRYDDKDAEKFDGWHGRVFEGPVGMDVKMRLWEFGGEIANHLPTRP